jgi:hypothetical protein
MRVQALLIPAWLVAAAAGSLSGATAANWFDPDLPEAPPLHTFGPQEEAVFDPLQGMDADGRIPKVPLPIDLPNPERWRYVPEGRLKPGNVFERFMVSSFIAPIVYYEEAVGRSSSACSPRSRPSASRTTASFGSAGSTTATCRPAAR